MTPKITPIEIQVNARREFTKTQITGYLIENLLNEKEFDSLLKYWEQFHVMGVDFDRTTYVYKGKEYVTANPRSFGESYDRKIFDLVENPEWYYQTPDTMYKWAMTQFGRQAHSRIFQVFQKIMALPPFNQEPDKWIAWRGLINVLKYGHLLENHLDSDHSLFDMPQDQVREYSVTIYLNSVSPGGEFWLDGDFIYKPVPNTAFIFPGGHVFHGVNINLDENQTTRKAITLRIVHVDSLHLPGDPSKFLYKSPKANI